MHGNEMWGHGSADVYGALGEANGFDPSRPLPAPIAAAPAPVAPVPEVILPVGPQAKIYRGRVRTGQRIENPNGDLVIIGDVNNGAELIASGHIHVYGKFAGRALAGDGGHRRAMVCTSSFQGELVSIGGSYMVFETVPESLHSKAVVFTLENDALNTHVL
jgi:septum site-determining protein MinC